MRLYEIDKTIEQLLTVDGDEAIDIETGEVIDIGKMLDELEIARDDKWENIAKLIKNNEAEVEALKKEEASLATRRKQREKNIERLKTYLSNSLLSSGQSKFERPSCVLSFRKSEVVQIENENLLDKKYIVEVIERKADKIAIKEAIKNGEEVKGAEIVVKQNLQVR